MNLKMPSMVFAALLAASAPALNVVYDDRTPESHRKWADGCYLREQMEVLGAKICKALYGDNPRSRLHEDFTITLYLAPTRGGNPAFASGRRITWKLGEHPSGNPGLGLITHEMTHVLDMGSDRVFTEAMADWVRNYMVCTDPATTLNRRHSALRGSRSYGKYIAGAHFIDFMTQTYGEGTIYKILCGYRDYGGKVWEKVFGKDFSGLLAEWRQMETIHDPVFQWTYNGTAEGVVRNDGKYCILKGVFAEEAADKAGAWLKGPVECKVANAADGDLTLAFHGRFPKASKTAIASLGSVKTGNGKALLLASTLKADTLAAHVVAALPGRGCQIVSSTPVPVPGLSSSPHSIILTVKGGDAAAVIVDGKVAAKIDMKAKCSGCTFTPAFALGGICGGFGVSGFSEPLGKGGVMLDDARVFTRTFRTKESANYATTFGPDYRGAVAVEATWAGEQGSSEIDSTDNWRCFNSAGEKIVALPSADTVVTVLTKALPSIPPRSKFACKSFTIDGLAVVDSANIDLRGVRIVDLADNTRIITRGGYGIAVNALRANRVRLDGTLAVTAGMKIADNLEMTQGSVLRLPADPDKAFVKSISVKGEGNVTIKPGTPPKSGSFQKILRMETIPEDLTRFRLNPSDRPLDAVFKAATGGKYLGVTSHKKE